MMYHREDVVNTKKGDRFAQRGMRRVGMVGLAKSTRVHREKCPDTKAPRAGACANPIGCLPYLKINSKQK